METTGVLGWLLSTSRLFPATGNLPSSSEERDPNRADLQPEPALSASRGSDKLLAFPVQVVQPGAVPCGHGVREQQLRG